MLVIPFSIIDICLNVDFWRYFASRLIGGAAPPSIESWLKCNGTGEKRTNDLQIMEVVGHDIYAIGTQVHVHTPRVVLFIAVTVNELTNTLFFALSVAYGHNLTIILCPTGRSWLQFYFSCTIRMHFKSKRELYRCY